MFDRSRENQDGSDTGKPSGYATRIPTPAAGGRVARSLTLAAMSLGFGVVQLDVTIVNTALNSIDTSVGGGTQGLQWIVSAYTIAGKTVERTLPLRLH
jgi:DHA2 family methylenomycin A resistance protein-like MFS transporter